MDHAQDSTPRREAGGDPSDGPRSAHAAALHKLLAEMAAGNQQFAEVSASILADLQTQAHELAAHVGVEHGEAPSGADGTVPPANTALMQELLAEVRSARAQVQNLQEEVYATRQHFCERQQRSRNKLAEMLQLAVNEADIP